MENASKALIIAGSILLSILIIALGMFIFSSSSSTSDSMGTVLGENEKQTFNIKFEKYVGTQTGSSVASLISAVRTNAVTNQSSKDMIVSVDFWDRDATNVTKHVDGNKDLSEESVRTSYVEDLSEITNALTKSHNYFVTLQYNDSGLVSKIRIEYTQDKSRTWQGDTGDKKKEE